MATPNWLVAPFDFANSAFLPEVAAAIQALSLTGPVSIVDATDASTTQLVPITQAQGHQVNLKSPVCPVALPAVPAGQTLAQIVVHAQQDATGGRTINWAPAGAPAINWLGGVAPVLASAANALTVITFYGFAGQWFGAASSGVVDTRPISRTRSTDSAPVNNSTVLVADDTLIAPLKANTTYDVRAELGINSSAAPDILIGWLFPAGTTGLWTPDGLVTTVATNQGSVIRSQLDISASAAIGGSGAGVVGVAKCSGSFKTGSTAGNLIVTYAQAVANASNTLLAAGSRLLVTECQ